MIFILFVIIAVVALVNLVFWVIFFKNQAVPVGTIMVMRGEGDKLIYSLDLDGDPAELQNYTKVSFNIDSHI